MLVFWSWLCDGSDVRNFEVRGPKEISVNNLRGQSVINLATNIANKNHKRLARIRSFVQFSLTSLPSSYWEKLLQKGNRKWYL